MSHDHPNQDSFAQWSQNFKKARTQVGDNKLVIKLWQEQMQKLGEWRRTNWGREAGFTRNPKGGVTRGEMKTEQLMLGELGKLKRLQLCRNDQNYQLISVYHAAPSANPRSGQVIADVLGVVQVKKELHPLLVEIKTTDRDPWYALVECLQQVKLARANEKNLVQMLSRWVSPKPKGAWGLVVAPAGYYNKHKGILTKCEKLLEELKKTKARVAFAAGDQLENLRLDWVCGNWR